MSAVGESATLGRIAFRAIGTSIEVLVTDPRLVAEGEQVTRDYLGALDLAASRFRQDSEVSELARSAAQGALTTKVSPLLADHIRAALVATSLTNGLLDPTMGTALIANGYDADLAVVLARPSFSPSHVPGLVSGREVSITEDDMLSVPQGAVIDLGATAKAHAADRIAADLASRFDVGFLVNLGGDIAVGGPAPAGGWQVGIEAADGRELQVVALTDQGLATSSTRLRRWAIDGGESHHIIDPRTGRSASEHWAQVSCAAVNALQANAASTAAIILAHEAPAWLTGHGLAARLDPLHGSPQFTPGWPQPSSPEGPQR